MRREGGKVYKVFVRLLEQEKRGAKLCEEEDHGPKQRETRRSQLSVPQAA